MLTNSMAHKYQCTNKCKKNHCYNQFCGWFRYFLEVCRRRAECNTIQLISLLKLSSDSVTKGTLIQKRKISVVGLVHGWIDCLYYPIPLQWVYLHWSLKTHPFLLFLELSKRNLSCKSQSSSCYTCVTFWPWHMCDILTDEHMMQWQKKRSLCNAKSAQILCILHSKRTQHLR